MATALVQCIQCEETVTYRLKHFLCSLTMHRSVPGPSFRVPHNRVGELQWPYWSKYKRCCTCKLWTNNERVLQVDASEYPFAYSDVQELQGYACRHAVRAGHHTGAVHTQLKLDQ